MGVLYHRHSEYHKKGASLACNSKTLRITEYNQVKSRDQILRVKREKKV